MSRCSGSSARPVEGGESLRAHRPGPTPTSHRRRHAIAYYENSPDSEEVFIHVTLPVNADPSHDHDFSIVDLPEIEQAATIVHRGSMDNVMPTIQALDRRERLPLRWLQPRALHRVR